jgi:hypothetical protein
MGASKAVAFSVVTRRGVFFGVTRVFRCQTDFSLSHGGALIKAFYKLFYGLHTALLKPW